MISGDTRVAELSFKHYYTSTVSKDVEPITYNDTARKIVVNIDKIVISGGREVVDTSWNKAGVTYDLLVRDGANNWEKASVLTGAEIKGIRINVINDNGIQDAGTQLRVTVTVQNVAESEDHGNSSDVIAYTKPRYDGAGQVEIGTAGKNAMTLSLRNYTSTDGYDIQEIGGKYYTFVKIDCYDQRQITNKASKLNITESMLTTDLADVKNGNWDKIAVIGSVSDAIDVIGARKNSSNRYERATSNADYIGIALKDEAKGTAMKGGNIKIYFGDNVNPKRTFTPISVKVADVANVNVALGTAAGKCYQEVNVATLTSGAGEDELDKGLVGYKVYKNSVSPANQVANLLPADEGSYRKATNKAFGFIESQDKLGEVKVAFWSRDPGTYIVVPYVVKTNRDASVHITYTATEDTAINKIKFGEISSTGNLVEKTTVDAKIGAKTDLGIEFYHIYENVDGKPEKKLADKDVPYKSIKYTKATAGNWTVASTDGGVDFSNDPDAQEEAIVNGIRVTIPKEIGEDQFLKFAITAGSYRFPERSTDYITIVTKAPAVATKVDVGNTSGPTENIPIYEQEPVGTLTGNVYAVTYDARTYDIYKEGTTYYTLLPIALKDNANNEVISDELTENKVKADITTQGKNNGEVTFIDNINHDTRTTRQADYFDPKSWIAVQGFIKTSSGYRKASSGEIWDYVGIYITYDPDDGIWIYETEADYDDDNGIQKQLENIYVYYTDENGHTNKWKTLNVGVIGAASGASTEASAKTKTKANAKEQEQEPKPEENKASEINNNTVNE